MNDLEEIVSYKNSGLEKRLKTFVSLLKRKKLAGSFVVSQETANILKIAISISDGTAKQMMQLLKSIGKILMQVAPIELAIGNIVRRFLSLIRDEYSEYEKKLQNNNTIGELDFDQDHPIKANVITRIDDFLDELTGLYDHISEKASEHIHSNEVIMTFGRSKTVTEFLKTAAKKRQFEVIVPESAPKGVGKHTACELANAKIKTTLISDSAIFAMMARVNKVIIGVHAVLANGGLLSWTGTHMLVSAAKYHNVPVVVLVPLYKLTPIFPNENQNLLNDLNSPSEVLQFENVEDQGVDVVVQNPGFDYVPPEYVNLFLTNSNAGGHNPSYIYRLLVEYYHPDDTYFMN